MHVEYAQYPPAESSADRIFLTDNAVIVLDGATAFVRGQIDAGTYAENLGRRIMTRLGSAAELSLRECLADAIAATADALDLRAGRAPSATVAIVRENDSNVELLVLGDTPILWAAGAVEHRLVDERLGALPLPHRERYRARLRAGHGYDQEHRTLLRALQAEQMRYRNTEGGYWIAEADRRAAYQALTRTIDRKEINWAILATDGAASPLTHLATTSWAEVATARSEVLLQLVKDAYRWERDHDPHGQRFPRAKRHDDKTVAAVTFPSR
jgi:hypothetical protein